LNGKAAVLLLDGRGGRLSRAQLAPHEREHAVPEGAGRRAAKEQLKDRRTLPQEGEVTTHSGGLSQSLKGGAGEVSLSRCPKEPLCGLGGRGEEMLLLLLLLLLLGMCLLMLCML
jgi:hypothetical protein